MCARDRRTARQNLNTSSFRFQEAQDSDVRVMTQLESDRAGFKFLHVELVLLLPPRPDTEGTMRSPAFQDV